MMDLSGHFLKRANPGWRSVSTLYPILAAFFLMSACSTGPPQPTLPTLKAVTLRIGDVVETATGKVIGMDELIVRLSRVSVVYSAEIHTSEEDHKVQLAILEKLSNPGRCVELAMEMFPASAQPILDSYITGQMAEEDFLERSRWKQVWGFSYALYRDLINRQKDKHTTVLGLNAPNDIVRKIAHNGLNSLTPDERSQVAREFHLDDFANRTRIRKEYTEHQKGEIKDFESFFEAQLAWEETMAQNLAQHLQNMRQDCIIMVAIGRGHINDRLGVPYLTRLRTPHEYSTVASLPIDQPFSTLDPGIADYVVVSGQPP